MLLDSWDSPKISFRQKSIVLSSFSCCCLFCVKNRISLARLSISACKISEWVPLKVLQPNWPLCIHFGGSKQESGLSLLFRSQEKFKTIVWKSQKNFLLFLRKALLLSTVSDPILWHMSFRSLLYLVFMYFS